MAEACRAASTENPTPFPVDCAAAACRCADGRPDNRAVASILDVIDREPADG